MNFFNLLGEASGGPFGATIESSGMMDWMKSIAKFLDSIIVPVTIIVAILGAVWIIWLGVQLAKAEDSGKQADAKKKLVNVAIAIVSVIILIWLLTWFAASAGSIFGLNAIEPV